MINSEVDIVSSSVAAVPDSNKRQLNKRIKMECFNERKDSIGELAILLCSLVRVTWRDAEREIMLCSLVKELNRCRERNIFIHKGCWRNLITFRYSKEDIDCYRMVEKFRGIRSYIQSDGFIPSDFFAPPTDIDEWLLTFVLI